MQARLTLLALVLACGCKQATEDAPKESAAETDWKSAFKHAERWDPARRAVVVDIELMPGFHAYAAGETVGKPLRVELAEDSELQIAGELVYPKGEARELPLGRSVIVEGRAEIVAPVAAKDGQLEGKSARGRLHYQVCTESACDRPRTASFEVRPGT